MKLKDVLEAMYSTTQYWILPSGKVKKMRSGHEEYLADKGMSYGNAFLDGHIRLAVDDEDGTPSAEWSNEATPAAKKSLGTFIKKSDDGVLYYDLIKLNPQAGKTKRTPKTTYLKSGNTDYKGFMRIR